MSEYKVTLDVYNGPLDLLLFLIRREEVDIYDIPISHITGQFIQFVELLRELDPEGVSEFLVLAATLMEIKSRTLLPRMPEQEDDDEIVDPRLELVRQLLEYKKFKDAARFLDDSAAQRAQKHARIPPLPPTPTDEVELENIDVWDLFDAFNRMLEQTGRREQVHSVGIDDTPIALHAEDILDSIKRAEGSQKFEEIFAGRSKQEMIGLFLALLELIRKRCIRVTQDEAFGTIWIHFVDPSSLDADVEPIAFEDEPWTQDVLEDEQSTDDSAPMVAETAAIENPASVSGEEVDQADLDTTPPADVDLPAMEPNDETE